MDVSIIIVNYNTVHLLHNCLESILSQVKDLKFEIIVIDNGSVDESVAVVKEKYPYIRLVENKENLGFGAANNIGINLSKGKYVLFLNSDTVLLNNAIKVFFDYLENHAHINIAGCGGALYNDDMTTQISYGNFPTLLSILFKNFYLYKFFLKNYFFDKLNMAGYVKNGEIKEVDYITGADLFLRKDVLLRYGGFDQDFFLFFEETELCFRIKNQGYKLVILPEAKIKHLCGKSTEKLPSLATFKHFEKSRYTFYRKCYPVLFPSLAKVIALIRYSIFILFLGKKKENVLKFKIIASS